MLKLTTTLLAVTQADVGAYFYALVNVYTVLILIHVLVGLIFTLGVRPPATPIVEYMVRFLREVCEPFLGLFRRFIPAIGPLDISPIVAILVLQIGGGLLARVIAG